MGISSQQDRNIALTMYLGYSVKARKKENHERERGGNLLDNSQAYTAESLLQILDADALSVLTAPYQPQHLSDGHKPFIMPSVACANLPTVYPDH